MNLDIQTSSSVYIFASIYIVWHDILHLLFTWSLVFFLGQVSLYEKKNTNYQKRFLLLISTPTNNHSISIATMKHFLQVLTLASLALAFDHSARESKRQLGDRVGSTANEFKDDGCNDIIFVWARGSTEIGNMVCLIL